VYANPAKVNKINHIGERYQVEGPHLVSPSPQRTPLLFQAGSSVRGKKFAAKHAEATFIISPTPEEAKKRIDETRKLAVEYGRNPDDIKFYQGLSFVVGSTEEEAKRKSEELDQYLDLEVMIAHFAGSMEMDLGNVALDTPLGDIQTEGMQSLLDNVRVVAGNREAMVRDLALYLSKLTRIVGTPEQIADELEKWSVAGVDGINVNNFTIPGTYEEFMELVIPVLRERGLAKPQQQEPSTFRAKLFGSDRVNERHPAAQYRGAFAEKLEVK
jgi:long-chain alkane monooxygenase